jgi:hypothetical protein
LGTLSRRTHVCTSVLRRSRVSLLLCTRYSSTNPPIARLLQGAGLLQPMQILETATTLRTGGDSWSGVHSCDKPGDNPLILHDASEHSCTFTKRSQRDTLVCGLHVHDVSQHVCVTVTGRCIPNDLGVGARTLPAEMCRIHKSQTPAHDQVP